MQRAIWDLKRRLMPLLHALSKVYWRVFQPTTVGVKLLLIQGGQALLVRHTYGAGWHLVGGGVKRCEAAEAAGRREAREEVGATLGLLRLFGVYDHFSEHKNDHVIVFVCDDFRLAEAHSPEIAETRCFDLRDLPAEVSGATRRRIEEYLNPQWTPAAGVW